MALIGGHDSRVKYAPLPETSRTPMRLADRLTDARFKKNLADQALEIFRDCVTKSPNNPTFCYHLAQALIQTDRKEFASCWRRSAEHSTRACLYS